MNENKLRDIIREIISEINIEESDLVAREEIGGQTWEDLSKDFEGRTKKIISDISNDNYKSALDGIDALTGILKVWKRRIMTGNKYEKPELQSEPEDYNFSKFSF
jgi:hypothetical protein